MLVKNRPLPPKIDPLPLLVYQPCPWSWCPFASVSTAAIDTQTQIRRLGPEETAAIRSKYGASSSRTATSFSSRFPRPWVSARSVLSVHPSLRPSVSRIQTLFCPPNVPRAPCLAQCALLKHASSVCAQGVGGEEPLPLSILCLDDAELVRGAGRAEGVGAAVSERRTGSG